MGEPSIDMGGRKIGWLCSFVPEELILAAGLEPIRIQGRVDAIEQAGGYLFPKICPYVKNLFDSGLRLKLEGVAGMIFANSCDGMRRLLDLWRQYVGTPFSHMLEVPKNLTEEAVTYFADRLLDLKKSLEGAFGVEISERKLKQAICVMNEHRSLVARIFEAQKEDPPRYQGSELLSILTAEGTRPKGETTPLLRDLAMGRGATGSGSNRGIRLLVLGNRIDRPALFDMIEKAGGSIAAFDTCNGLRHYADLVENSLAPLEALARRYLLKPSCPRMPGFEARLERVKLLAREFRVQGILYSALKYCDYGLFETPQVEKLSRELGLPALVLEDDYVGADIGRVRTRVEAFLEMVRR